MNPKKESDPKFYLFVNGMCKSAGTLIAIGADVYLLTERAEFGPIDTQIRKPDEAWRTNLKSDYNGSI